MTAKTTAIPRSARPALRALFIAGLALGLSACVSDGPSGVSALQPVETGPAQPRRVTYNCGEDGPIMVEAMRGAVRLVEPEGSSYDLPASPPTQSNRFGEGNMALVVEDGEALWMKAGREPIACKQ